jgi:hypothetical protein
MVSSAVSEDEREHEGLRRQEEAGELDAAEELPVVARMVVEIRSDGSRTIARGAVEDRLSDQQVAVEARADSPLELSRALAKMLLSAPFAAGTVLLGRGASGAPERQVEEPAPKGLRGRVGALGRKVGERLERRLITRLADVARTPDDDS